MTRATTLMFSDLFDKLRGAPREHGFAQGKKSAYRFIHDSRPYTTQDCTLHDGRCLSSDAQRGIGEVSGR